MDLGDAAVFESFLLLTDVFNREDFLPKVPPETRPHMSASLAAKDLRELWLFMLETFMSKKQTS